MRPPRETDAHRIADICRDAEIARWTNVPSPYTLENARGWIALAQIERDRGIGLHLVGVRLADRVLVGAAALRVHDRPQRHGEVGYWVAAEARRAGIALRMLALLSELALGALELTYIEALIAPDNAASLALAGRAEFTSGERRLREFKGEMTEFEVWRKDAPG